MMGNSSLFENFLEPGGERGRKRENQRVLSAPTGGMKAF